MNNIKLVKLLLKNGANIDAVNERGETAIDIARVNGYKEIEEILERHKCESHHLR